MIEKYNARAISIDSMLCVGLDADFAKLPENFKKFDEPQFEFNKWIIDSTHKYAAAFKPNSAFYEARGDAGVRELKLTIEYIKENHPDIFTILDAKRGDIGNTNSGYVTFAFDWLGFNAVTLQPYLGFEAISPFLERKDKCSIILAKTSNAGAPELQDLVLGDTGELLWQHVAAQASTVWNTNNNVALVIGATYPEDIETARDIAGDITFLIPGVGAQGGSVEDVVKVGLNSSGLGLIINSSRGIIFSEDPEKEAEKLRDEIREAKNKID